MVLLGLIIIRYGTHPVFELKLVIGMWHRHKFDHFHIMLSASVSELLLINDHPFILQPPNCPLPYTPPPQLTIILYCFYLKNSNHYISFLIIYFYGSGRIPTLDRFVVFMKWYSLSIYTEYLSKLKEKRAPLKLWCKVQV